MSLQRFLTDTATVWTEVRNDPGDPLTGSTWQREVIDVCRKGGGRIRPDETGAEFTPKMTVWGVYPFKFGQYIKIGFVPDPKPPADADRVRAVDSFTPHPRRGGVTEYAAFTG